MAAHSITRMAPTVVFFAMALLPVALIGNPGAWPGADDFRPEMIRRLAPFPDTLAAEMFRRMGDWFADRIGQRMSLMWLGNQAHVRFLRRAMSPHVLYGRDDWVFWNDDESGHAAAMNDMRGRARLGTAAIVRIETQWRSVRDALAPCDREALIVVSPNKQSIYPEQLRGFVDRHASSRLDDFLQRLSPPARAMIIDPRPILHKAKSAHDHPLYFKGDSHWNGLGAFYAYRSVVDALARGGVIARPELASLEHYDIGVESLHGDLARRMMAAPWYVDDSITLRGKGLIPPVKSTTAADGHDVFTNVAGAGRLVMVGDSFADPLALALARHFAEVHLYLVSRGSIIRFDGELIARHRADVELLEIAERHLGDLDVEPVHLRRACDGQD